MPDWLPKWLSHFTFSLPGYELDFSASSTLDVFFFYYSHPSGYDIVSLWF